MIGEVLREIRAFDPGDWSESDIAIGASMLGWRPAGEVHPDGRRELWVQTSRSDVRGELADAARDGETKGVRIGEVFFTIATDDPFASVVEEMSALFGQPATLTDGPRVMWYSSSVRAECARGLVTGQIRVRFEPWPDCEREELGSLRWGSVLSPPYLWRADQDSLLPDGAQIEPGLLASSVTEVVDQLPRVLESLREAAVVLPGLLPQPTWIIFRDDAPSTFVQGYFTTSECVLDETGEADGPLFPATREGAAAVAARTSEIIGSWAVRDPDELRLKVFVSGSTRSIIVPGLGLALA